MNCLLTMISHSYSSPTIYVADYTHYNEKLQQFASPCAGVLIQDSLPPLIPSFLLTNKNAYPLVAVNMDENKYLLKQKDGTIHSQCECILYAQREDSPAWMLFVELKYCEEKSVYENTIKAMSQLKKTCKYLLEKKFVFDSTHFRRYFVVSTPGVEPLDPFDANYFDQEDMLQYKEECAAILFLSNQVNVHTPIHLKIPK